MINSTRPVVLKAPNSSFSMYVEKAETLEEFVKGGNRFLRRSDRVVAQRFIKSDFDWRVGVLAGEVIYVCQYTISRKHWKIMTYIENGKTIYGPVRGVKIKDADPKLLDTALRAAGAIGNSLYGIDLKQYGDEYVTIEVNDNPTINTGEEGLEAADLYEKIIRYLMNESS